MPKFIKILPFTDSPDSSIIQALLQVCQLARDNARLLFDDYAPVNKNSEIPEFGEYFINSMNPLWIVLDDNTGEFAGFASLDGWNGGKGKYHSACISTCFRKKYWGKFTKWASKKFIKYVFKKYALTKLKAEIFAHNKNAIALLKHAGFEPEGFLKDETLSGGALCDIVIYSKIKRS